MPTKLPLIAKGDAVAAEGPKGENEVRKALNGLLAMGVDTNVMTLQWQGSTPYLGLARPLLHIVEGVAAGAIAAAAGPTMPTAGTITIYRWDESTSAMVATTDTADVWNDDSSSTGDIASGQSIKAMWTGARYFIFYVLCP